MADDLASFFKSKKSKKHGSGQRGGLSSSIQTPDALAKRLERTVQQQQEIDRENGVDENEDLEQTRAPYSHQLSSGGGGSGTGPGPAGEPTNEESEWLDIQEQQDIDLAKLGIKEMEIAEESDDEGNEDEESINNRRTWNLPGQQQDKKGQSQKVTYAAGMDIDEGEEGANVEEKAATNQQEEPEKKDEESEASKAEEEKDEPKQKYVPPSLRNKQLAAVTNPGLSTKKPNLEDSMEFPSLAAAGELEAEFEKTKKKKPPPQFAKKAASPAPVHAPSPPADDGRSARPTVPTHAAASESPAEPPKSAYVPPHLRKRGGAS